MREIVASEWTDFFAAEVGASAALTGLVVVAISINLEKILSLLYLPGRAAEALVMLVAVLVLTSAALIPHQPAAALGGEALTIGAASYLAAIFIQVRSLKSGTTFPAMRVFVRISVAAATNLPIIFGGLLLMHGSDAGLYWIAAGVILSLVAGVLNAWVLLIEILR